MKTALIIGVNGQDGSYLAELLVEKGYHVVGWMPEGIPYNSDNLQTIQDRIKLIDGNLLSQDSMNRTIEEHHPDEVYNLASPSFAASSWNNPVLVGEVAGLGVLRVLEAIRHVHPQARFFQASSSELFGLPSQSPQNEETPFRPRNPYGAAKLYGHCSTILYREQYGQYAVSGILYNHESPRRGLEFVTRKIIYYAVQIKKGLRDQLPLGNLDARRDWGYAGDYVEAMWLMLQQDHADDFVIGTGETHSVRDLCRLSFELLDLDYRDYVVQDNDLYRPSESVQLVADCRKIRQKIGWEPKLSFEKMVRLMVETECKMQSCSAMPG